LKALQIGKVSSASDVIADPDNTIVETNILSEASTVSHGCRGKAPTVDAYTSSDPELRFDDHWLPTLEQGSSQGSLRGSS